MHKLTGVIKPRCAINMLHITTPCVGVGAASGHVAVVRPRRELAGLGPRHRAGADREPEPDGTVEARAGRDGGLWLEV